MNSQVRIIAGKWRGRKINFTANDDLRPTPDRVRETLFNWLQHITAANCLDLFAGSGALGIESLSRGAKSVTFVEKSKACCDHIAQTIAIMDSSIKPQIYNLPFDIGIKRLEGQQFDVIFLDPPYNTEILAQACKTIIASNLLTANGLIYCEAAKGHDICYPPELKIIKTKTYGQVTFSLLNLEKAE